MALYRGTNAITAVYRGTNAIVAIYRGAALVWNGAGVGDDFERADGVLGTNWTDLLTGSFHKLGVEDGRLRLALPDGLIGLFWDFTTSTYRYNAAQAGGAFVEGRLATQGDSASLTSLAGYYTDVFHRANNTGSTHTSGIGYRARGGQLYLVSRVSSTTTERVTGGPFQSGDLARVGSVGNVHTLYLNGQPKGSWTDAGNTVPNTSSERSLVVTAQAAKDFLGPRRFSPALDYVLAG